MPEFIRRMRYSDTGWHICHTSHYLVTSLNGSSDSVNGHLQFLWELANYNPHKIDTPGPINK